MDQQYKLDRGVMAVTCRAFSGYEVYSEREIQTSVRNLITAEWDRRDVEHL